MSKKYRNPTPTVDIIITNEKKQVVLIKRKNIPLGWAIPGGFAEYGETLYSAALREAEEETNLKVEIYEQFHTYSNPARDPRQHTVTTVFLADCFDFSKLKGLDDAEHAEMFSFEDLPDNIAFDHRQILEEVFYYFNTGEKKISFDR